MTSGMRDQSAGAGRSGAPAVVAHPSAAAADEAAELPPVLARRRGAAGRPARLRLGIGAAVVLVLAAAAAAVLVTGIQSRGEVRTVTGVVVSAGPLATTAPAPSAAASVLYVHVAGAVTDAGLHVLPLGARVADAIAAAGGFAGDAERAAVNLARPLVDGEQIVVPVQGALAQPGAAGAAAGGIAGGAASGGAATGAAASGAAAGGAVSLSSATAAQLEDLPEIGPSTAAKIIAYREANGPFTSVDQLLEVPGIGEKTLDAFRDAVVP